MASNAILSQGTRFYIQALGTNGSAKTITAITQANPAVVTSTAHALVTGDVVTFAGDATQYVVKTGITAPGTITLNQRTQDGGGLRVALASGAAMTIIGNATRNMAFHQSAIGLAIRPSAVPDGGDAATDRILMTDPVTGLTVGVAMYKQYMQQAFEIQATWGASMIRPELAKLVLG